MARLIARCVFQAGRPTEDHILAALDKPEPVQAFDLLAAERRLKREVEVAQLFDRGQAARAHRGLQPSIVSQLNLGGQQLLHRFRRGERTAVDPVENRMQGFRCAGHAQVRQHLAQPVAP